MTTRLALAFAGLTSSLAACMDQPGPGPGQEPDPATALPADAHFIALVPPYPTPEACIAEDPQPFSCEFSLSLCMNGRAGQRIGDLIAEGTYDMENSIAHVTYTDGSTLEFDVDAVVEIGSPNAHWIVDTERRWETLQFDNIDCSRP